VNFVLVKKNALMWSLLSLEFDAKYAKEKLKYKLESTFKTSLIMPLFLCLYLRILVTSWFYSIHTIKWIFDWKKCNFSVLWTKCVFDSTSHVFGNWLDRIEFFCFYINIEIFGSIAVLKVFVEISPSQMTLNRFHE
jgi:hypothetical protein